MFSAIIQSPVASYKYKYEIEVNGTGSFRFQASLKVWESQEEAKARLQAEIIRKIAQERQEQLEEKSRRVQNVSD